MKVVVVADHHYYRDKKRNVYVPSVYGYDYWKRFLNVFDKIYVAARGKDVDSVQNKNMLLSSGMGVEFQFIPDFSGLKGMATCYFEAKKTLDRIIKEADLVIIRVPSPLSTWAVNSCIKHKKKFGIEVVADPALSYEETPFSFIIERVMGGNCKKACLNANGVSYVTQNTLQSRYPCRARIEGESKYFFETYYSSASIPDYFFDCEKEYNAEKNAIELLHVSNVISGPDKGHYVCIDVMHELCLKGEDALLTFVGDGPEVPKIQEYAKEKRVENRIKFLGRFSDMKSLHECYLRADIVMLPSKTEGVPRCIIEAMACGVVCLASNVGGIPELLDKSELFEWNDHKAMCKRIVELKNDHLLMINIGKNNRSKARLYSSDVLQSRRDIFYEKLKQLPEMY